MKNRGFTLIEIAIVVAILGILLSIGTSAWQHHTKKDRGLQSENSVRSTPPEPGSNIYHAPEPIKVECVDGYKFVGGKQMLDSSGHGIYCN